MTAPPVQKPTLSLLILSLPSRIVSLGRLLGQLEQQIAAAARRKNDVEILCLTDNRVLTVGAKRNAVMQLARGRFVAFLDDDDRVSDDYLSRILTAVDERPDADCVVFDVWVRGYDRVGIGPKEGALCRYGTELQHRTVPGADGGGWERKPNHLMVYRADLARSVRFPEINSGEDDLWATTVSKLIRVQVSERRVIRFAHSCVCAPPPGTHSARAVSLRL